MRGEEAKHPDNDDAQSRQGPPRMIESPHVFVVFVFCFVFFSFLWFLFLFLLFMSTRVCSKRGFGMCFCCLPHVFRHFEGVRR